MRLALSTGLLIAGALAATVGVASAAVELVTNGGFETTTYTQSHQFGPGSPAQTGPNIPAGGTGMTGWTGTNIGRDAANSATNIASGAPFNLFFHPTTSNATAAGTSGYGVTYNNNSLSTTPLAASIEPINQYGGLSFLLSQGCGYNGTPSNPTGPARTDSCATPPADSTATIGTHPTRAGVTYTSTTPSNGATNTSAPFVLSPTNGNTPNTGPVTSTSGGNFVSLDGDFNFDGEIQQSLGGGINPLINGHWYTLSFWWAATEIQSFHLATNTNLTERIQYRIGNANGSNPNVCDTTSGAAPGAGGTCVFSTATVTQTVAHTFTGWMKETVTFRYVGATGGSSLTLAFLSIGSPNINSANGAPPMALLDGVSLVEAPEPATLAVLSIGLAGVIFVRRPRRHVATLAA